MVWNILRLLYKKAIHIKNARTAHTKFISGVITVNNQYYNSNLGELLKIAEEKYTIDKDLYNNFRVKRGLRNSDGTGVLAGLTAIGEVRGYVVDDGERSPIEGKLLYRGIDVCDIIKNAAAEDRFAYEEVVFLLLFGVLPSKKMLDSFCELLGSMRDLPPGFTEDTILNSPSANIMNKMARSVLTLYSYDDKADDISFPNLIRQSIELIARMVTIAAYGYQAKRRYYDKASLYLHSPQPNLSTAENFFYMTRPDSKFSKTEAEILDLLLVLQAEHGGGNNSAFVCRAVSSSGTDTYSAIAAAIGSLKGPKHGGANFKVLEMINDFKANIKHWDSDAEVGDYIRKTIRKGKLIYGMGHAVYTISDPRAVLLKEKAKGLAEKCGCSEEFVLYDAIERLTPDIFREEKGIDKSICANVDLYSGFVYQMLNIQPDLYTPLFAIARIVGWCAHRIEEVTCNGKIMRPAYKGVKKKGCYIKLADR